MTAFVHFIVSQFDLLKWDHLFAQLFHTVGRIRVQVETGGRRWVSLAGHQPTGTMVGVSVPFVVHWDNVHQHKQTTVAVHWYLVNARKGAPDSGEHASNKRKKNKKLEELNKSNEKFKNCKVSAEAHGSHSCIHSVCHNLSSLWLIVFWLSVQLVLILIIHREK